MNRILAVAAPGYSVGIPVLIHQRLKHGVAGNKAALTFAEKRVLVLGIGRRHASRNGQWIDVRHRTVASD